MSEAKFKRVVIKKYGNRRLYDTSGSRYVNLEDIAALIRNGNDVQVIDAKTSEDLTRVTLTQIILEDAKGQSSGLPLEMLRQLVMATDRVGRDFLMSYLKSAFDAYHKVQNSVQSTLSEVQAAAMSPLQTVKNFLARDTEPGPLQQTERTGHPPKRAVKKSTPRRRVRKSRT
jgi:polyhydroxyalkanoate synthesis repressor PhaR